MAFCMNSCSVPRGGLFCALFSVVVLTLVFFFLIGKMNKNCLQKRFLQLLRLVLTIVLRLVSIINVLKFRTVMGGLFTLRGNTIPNISKI